MKSSNSWEDVRDVLAVVAGVAIVTWALKEQPTPGDPVRGYIRGNNWGMLKEWDKQTRGW